MAIKQFGIFLTKNSQYFDDIAKMDAPLRVPSLDFTGLGVLCFSCLLSRSRTIVIPFPCDIC